jgi:hypothetical protein
MLTSVFDGSRAPFHGLPVNARAVLAIAALACASVHDRRQAAADAEAGTAAAGAAVPEDAPCASDADCALTRIAPGACCPMLCTSRVVTKERAQQLEARIPTCGGKADSCPQPLCRPPVRSIAPACEAGRCVGRVGATN